MVAIRKKFGDRRTAGKDVRAGLTLGVEGVPDGLAQGLLAGVNPLFGLYGYIVGLIAGSLSTSSALMSIETTSAVAVIVSDISLITDNPDDPALLGMLAILTGAALVVAWLLRIGRLVRFVSHSVLTGFVNAIAVSIILGQLDNLTGYDNAGANKLLQTVDTFANFGSFRWPSIAVGIGTIALILVLGVTRIGPLGLVIAVVVSSIAVRVGDIGSVPTLGDLTDIPRSLPAPVLPDLSAAGLLVIPALSIAFVAAVQGTAVSGSVPNPDGTTPDPSGDLRGAGLANLAAGFLGATPVGGSMSATTIMRTAGARTRLANLIAGITIGVVLVTMTDIIKEVAMPALAGLLIVVGIRTLRLRDVADVWRTGRNAAASMVATFVLTLIIPLQYAVLGGVFLSMLLHVIRESNKVAVRLWTFDETGRPTESEPPPTVGDSETIVLMVFGSLFFASGPTLERQLPDVVPGSRNSVVILRVRGQDGIGVTTLRILRRYAGALDRAGCGLVLVGVDDHLARQLDTTRSLETPGVLSIHRARPRVGDGLLDAMAESREWISHHESGA